jgi:hypothetical protein
MILVISLPPHNMAMISQRYDVKRNIQNVGCDVHVVTIERTILTEKLAKVPSRGAEVDVLVLISIDRCIYNTISTRSLLLLKILVRVINPIFIEVHFGDASPH